MPWPLNRGGNVETEAQKQMELDFNLDLSDSK